MGDLNRVPFDEFDPNNVEHFSVWAVFAPGTFKCYATRGPALNGFMGWTKAKLYENVNGRWELRALKDVDSRHDTCDVCHKPGVKESYKAYGQYAWSGRYWAWKRVKGGRSRISDPVELLFICLPCRTALGL